jgi:urea transport system substrate-binding protein
MKLKSAYLIACLAATVMLSGAAPRAQSLPTIKIGILHSLSGTMAISETTLKTPSS